MKKLLIMSGLLLMACSPEEDRLEPYSADSRIQSQPSALTVEVDARLRYKTSDGAVRPLEGAVLPKGLNYRIFTDRAALLWEGKSPFKCLFWLNDTYHNRENITPYDFNHAAQRKTGAGQNEDLPVGEYRLKVRSYYGSQENVIHQQEDVVSFTVVEDEAVVFFEDFNGTGLNEEKWASRFWWSCDPDGGQSGFNDNIQWFRPENVSVGDGYAYLKADDQPYDPLYREVFDYTGAVISTHHTDDTSCSDLPNQLRFEFRYGTVEVRMQLPQGGNLSGMWPAIWLITSDERHPPEIDLLEVLGEKPNEAQFHVHYRDETNQPAQYGKAATIAGLSEGFHTYTLEWTPDKLVWYVDGDSLYAVTDRKAIPDEELHLIINNAVSSGRWGQRPTNATTFPNTLSIDWIKITQPK